MKIVSKAFERLSTKCTEFAGSSAGFGIALSIVLIWGACGPIFHYAEMWQIFINTATTIVTFLMVFLIQRSQNKDVLALHAKLNELIASSEAASNRLVNIETMDEESLLKVARTFQRLSDGSDTAQVRKSIEDAIHDQS